MFSDVYVDNQNHLYIMKVTLISAIFILINYWFQWENVILVSECEWFHEQKTGNHQKLLLAVTLLLLKLLTWLNHHVIANLIIFLIITF